MKIKKNQIGFITAWIYIFLIFVTSDNFMLFVASGILTIGFVFSSLTGRKKVVLLNGYFYLQIFFVIFCFFQIIFKITVVESISWSTTRRLIINCIDEIMLFNILIRQVDIEKIFKTIIEPFVSGIVLIIFLQLRSGTLFDYRLTTDADKGSAFRLGEITINAGVATIIGHCAVCAFAFCLIYYYTKKEKKYLFLGIISLIGIFLSSTRKAIVVAIVLVVLIPMFRDFNRNKYKKIMFNIIKAIVILILVYVSVIKIPVLYDMIGLRFERMFMVIFNSDYIVDNSMNIRRELRFKAINVFFQRPVLGWGINTFKYYFNDGWIYSHCNYLELLEGTGIVGTSIFFSKYLYLLKKSLKLKGIGGVEGYYSKSISLWLILTWIMEYWQVAYYNERMIVHYIVVLALLFKLQKKSGDKESEILYNNSL